MPHCPLQTVVLSSVDKKKSLPGPEHGAFVHSHIYSEDFEQKFGVSSTRQKRQHFNTGG